MKRYIWTATLAMTLLGTTAIASAQDDDEETPPGLDDDDDNDTGAPDPEPEPEPDPPHEATMEASVSAAPNAPGRPDGFAIGIGLGYDLPADLQLPNTTSVRFRLPSGLTFEPRLVLGRSGTSFEPAVGDSQDSSVFELSVATDVRFPWRLRGPVDLILAGGALFGIASSNPDGDDNNSSTTSVALTWGLGLEYWRHSHWALSFTAMNPLVSFISTSQQEGPDLESSQSNSFFGIIFDPNITLMLHLFL